MPVEQLANRCTATRKLAAKSPAWAGWGANPANWRYQNAMQAGFSVASVPGLKLKWAFGIPNVKIVRSQPAIFGGRVYVGGNDGTVYSLDAATGCTYWATAEPKAVRSGLLIGKAGSEDAVFFGDAGGAVVALDAASGKFLWRTRADSHPAATITGTPSYFEGTALRAGIVGRGTGAEAAGLRVLHVSRQRGCARRGDRKDDLADVHGGGDSDSARENSGWAHDHWTFRDGDLVRAND